MSARRRPSKPPLTSIERMQNARSALQSDKGRAEVEGDRKRATLRKKQVDELGAKIDKGRLTKQTLRLPTRLTALDMALEARRSGRKDGLAKLGMGRNPFLSARHLHAAQLLRDYAESRATMGSPLSQGARLAALAGSGDPINRWFKGRSTTRVVGKDKQVRRVEPPPTMKPKMPKERRTGRGPDMAANMDRLQPLSSAFATLIDAMAREAKATADSAIVAAAMSVIVGAVTLRRASIDYLPRADGRTIARLKAVILAGLDEVAEQFNTQDFSEPDQLTSAAEMAINSYSRSKLAKSKAERDKLYKTKRWEQRRQRQLADEPLCRFCAEQDLVTLATDADHIKPHRGDEHEFYHGELQSLCHTCHSTLKQQQEINGYHRAIGPDGMPIDPNHPYNSANATNSSGDRVSPPTSSSETVHGERRGATTSINRNKKENGGAKKSSSGSKKTRSGQKKPRREPENG